MAACHISPVFFDAAATTSKAISHIRTASQNGANLVIFPETFIAAFPLWSSLQPPTENHAYFARMAAASISANGPEIASIREAAKTHSIIVNIGFSERADHSVGALYNSNMLISATGKVLVHHRKLMPTFFEKLTWAPGDGHGLVVADTDYGKIGTLICGENTNPLARYSLMAQGEELHISTWPAVWPTREPKRVPKASEVLAEENVKDKNYDNVAANRIRAAAHCFEAKCFGVLCASHMDSDYINVLCESATDAQKMRSQLEASSQGASMFLDPTGALIPGYVMRETGDRKKVDFLQREAGILYADLDLDDCVEGKQYHDVVGGYQRLDVFQLTVDRSRRDPVTFV